MTSIRPFRIEVPDETLERIRARVAAYPWHEMPDDGGWDIETAAQMNPIDEDFEDIQNWVDKVRAQRLARMAEYREVMQNRAELLEQAQRAHPRSINPHREYLRDMRDARRQLMQSYAENQRQQADLIWKQQEQWMFGHRPYGWNNPWYYRGY